MSYPEYDIIVSHYGPIMCFISVCISCYVAENHFLTSTTSEEEEYQLVPNTLQTTVYRTVPHCTVPNVT